MNDFLTRSFSGFFYAFLIIFSLIISEFFFTTIILIFTLLALVEFQRIINFTNLIPYIFLIIIFLLSTFKFKTQNITDKPHAPDSKGLAVDQVSCLIARQSSDLVELILDLRHKDRLPQYW